MPHKCMKCGKIYSDNEINLMNSCACGARFFLYSKTDEGLKSKGILETAEEKVFGLKEEISIERIGDTILMRKKEIEPETEKTSHVEEPEKEFEIKNMWEKEKKKPEIKAGEKKELKKEAPEEKIKEITSEEKKKPEIKAGEKKELKKEAPEEKIKETTSEEKKKPEIKFEEKKELKKEAPEAEKNAGEDELSWLEKEFKLSEKGLLSLDVETLKILRKGKYEIDVAALMSGKPLVIETKKGVYYIHLPTAMKKKKKM